MYALASLRCSLVSAALPAWQARDLVHCKGVRCTPWRPSGVPSSPPPHISLTHTSHTITHTHSDVRPGVPWSPPLCRWLLRGRRGTWCTAKGSDVRPAGGLCVGLVTWCTAKGSDVRPGVPPVSLGLRRFAGGFCAAGAALGALPRARGRRGTWCTAKGSDVHPGVLPVSLGLRRSVGGFCVAGAGLSALQTQSLQKSLIKERP